jgi:hypothetical protein
MYDPRGLTEFATSVPRGTAAPPVYITLTDRRTGQIVTSNTVSFAP